MSEKQLLRKLFDKNRDDAHDPRERPVSDEKEPLVVGLQLDLQQIIDVKWKDYHFAWEPLKYNNVTRLILPHTDVWTPDILLYNSVDQKIDSKLPTNVIASYDGNMTWIPPGIYQSSCEIMISLFPFDTQNCKLKFGIWTYHGQLVDLRFSDCNTTTCAAATSEFSTNGEWTLISESPSFHICQQQTYFNYRIRAGSLGT
ncbi:Neuronal acetylcholine receptor subunit alpha-3 [Cichlidogyrus casuarinus]|uniref:Neuronal acetylcholine receptor subunit alpha-3 n=1 Tax=Cichlidogyrus casuarinus TaxID=1844966 RepID=A0ABD2Q6I6_9PLAT